MPDKLKNILIGFFALLGITVTIVTVLFLKPTIGDGKKILKVRFSNIQGINIGTRVTFAGKPIGEVIEIQEVKDARKNIKDEFSRYYFYELKLKVDSSVQVYNTDIISLQTTGLMGEKSIAINPVASKNQNVHEISNEIIYADSLDSFESTARQINDLADKFDTSLNNFNKWFQDNSKNISNLITSFSNILQNVDNIKLINSINTAANSFSKSTDHLNLVLSTLSSNNTTFGKILNSDDLYLNFNAILSKANTMMNDINNYGILFQYSKGWQRQRIKKAYVLEKISTPREFKQFFSSEIDEITVSLGRLNKIIDLAKNKSQQNKLENSEIYKKDFATLMRQIDNLSYLIKLYNQNLFEKSKTD